jgi:hypothetical protein
MEEAYLACARPWVASVGTQEPTLTLEMVSEEKNHAQYVTYKSLVCKSTHREIYSVAHAYNRSPLPHF